MKTRLPTIVLAIIAIAANAGNPIPPELVGEWRTPDGNGILILQTDGAGVDIGGPPPIGVMFQASYDPKDSTITLKLRVSPGDTPKGTPPLPDVKLSYDSKDLTIKSTDGSRVSYKRTRDGLSGGFKPAESKAPWEQQWEQAWAIGRGEGTDSEKAIGCILEAIRLSPKDNEKLGTLWSYLGELYMDRKDYNRAEAAFKTHLSLVQAQSSPKPKDLLGVNAGLRMVYYWSGNLEAEKDALRSAIALNRMVYGDNSAREAECWQRLAEITHKSGNSEQAVVLLDRAIEIYSLTKVQHVPMDYLRRRLKQWKSE